MKHYYVYLLRCFDGTFYAGVTDDVERRFAEHCTYNRRPLLVAYVGEFSEISQAIAFEKQLKTRYCAARPSTSLAALATLRMTQGASSVRRVTLGRFDGDCFPVVTDAGGAAAGEFAA